MRCDNLQRPENQGEVVTPGESLHGDRGIWAQGDRALGSQLVGIRTSCHSRVNRRTFSKISRTFYVHALASEPSQGMAPLRMCPGYIWSLP